MDPDDPVARPYRPRFTGEYAKLGPLTQAMADDYRDEARRDALRCMQCSGELALHDDPARDRTIGRCRECGERTEYTGEIAHEITMDRAAEILRERSHAFGTARRVELGEL